MNIAIDYEMARANGDSQFASSLVHTLADSGLRIIETEPCSLVISKSADEGAFDQTVRTLVAAREAARNARNYKESDRIRDELAKMGVVLKDSKDGTTWEIAR
jgi:cysteinyl-tRNA synthetase